MRVSSEVTLSQWCRLTNIRETDKIVIIVVKWIEEPDNAKNDDRRQNKDKLGKKNIATRERFGEHIIQKVSSLFESRL